MDDFQVAMNVLQARVTELCGTPKCKAWTSHSMRCSASRCHSCNPTHYALQRMVFGTNVEVLYNKLVEARADLEKQMMCTLSTAPVDIISQIEKHIASLVCNRNCEGCCHSCISRCATEDELHNSDRGRDGATGVCWGIFSNLPVVTFSPALQRWVSWSDVEYAAALCTDGKDLHSAFRKVSAAELSKAKMVNDKAIADTDMRSFYAVSFVGLQRRGVDVVHELVVAVGGGFLGVLASDVRANDIYLFRVCSRVDPDASSKKRTRNGECKSRDIILEAQSGGYLTFVIHNVLSEYKTSTIDFSHVMSYVGSPQRDAITTRAGEYTRAASRIWATERMVQCIRREMTLDTKQERFSHELSGLTSNERVFTGSIFHDDLSLDLEQRDALFLEENDLSLKRDVHNVLAIVCALERDSVHNKLVYERTRDHVQSALIHKLHMQGDVKAATVLAQAL